MRRFGRRNADLRGNLPFSHGWSRFFWGIVVATSWEAFAYPWALILAVAVVVVARWGSAHLRRNGNRPETPY